MPRAVLHPYVLPTVLLLGVTAVWGSTFFLLKELLQQISPLDFLGVRFGIAALVVAAARFRVLRQASRKVWTHGAVLGLIYAAAQVAQTIGLQTTAASVSGFITGMYVVFTPIIGGMLFRQRVAAKTWAAVVVATVGLGVLTLEGFAFGTGEAITLLGALGYGFHIAFLGRWSNPKEAEQLGLVQIIAVGAVSFVAAIPGGITVPQTPKGWVVLLYMALIAGAATIVAQTWAQARLPATTAAVIMTTEPVFAASFAVLFGGESLTVRLLVGGALVLAAMVLVESGAPPDPTPPNDSDEANSGLPAAQTRPG